MYQHIIFGCLDYQKPWLVISSGISRLALVKHVFPFSGTLKLEF